MKIIILGASGTIGNAIYQCLSTQYKVYGTYNKNKPDNIKEKFLLKYDIADDTCLDTMLNNIKPDLIISSLTGNFEHQFSAHEHIAKYLKKTSGHCIFISTANVFDGSPDGSHTELDTPYPISQYGKYKYACEQLLQGCLREKCLIVRLPRTLSAKDALIEIQQVENGQPVFTNFYLSYNTANNVAKTIRFCIEVNKCGIVHLTSTDIISSNEFVKSLLLHYKKNINYTVDSFTIDSYCGVLGCDDPALIRYGNDSNFYLALGSVDSDLKKYSLSCKNVISSL